MQFVSDYMRFNCFGGARRHRYCFTLSPGIHMAFDCGNSRSHLGCKSVVWCVLTDLLTVLRLIVNEEISALREQIAASPPR